MKQTCASVLRLPSRNHPFSLDEQPPTTAKIAVSLTPSIPSSLSIERSEITPMQNAPSPSAVETRRKDWEICPASSRKARYTLGILYFQAVLSTTAVIKNKTLAFLVHVCPA